MEPVSSSVTMNITCHTDAGLEDIEISTTAPLGESIRTALGHSTGAPLIISMGGEPIDEELSPDENGVNEGANMDVIVKRLEFTPFHIPALSVPTRFAIPPS